MSRLRSSARVGDDHQSHAFRGAPVAPPEVSCTSLATTQKGGERDVDMYQAAYRLPADETELEGTAVAVSAQIGGVYLSRP